MEEVGSRGSLHRSGETIALEGHGSLYATQASQRMEQVVSHDIGGAGADNCVEEGDLGVQFGSPEESVGKMVREHQGNGLR